MVFDFFKKYICIKQENDSENLFACLLTYFRQIKHPITFNELKEKIISHAEKDPENSLVSTIQKLGYTFKKLDLEKSSSLIKLPMPLLAEISTSFGKAHFAVIHRVTKNRVLVADPVKGLVEYNTEAFKKIWTGKLFMISVAEKMKVEIDKKLLWRLIALLLPYKKYFLTLFFASILFTLLGIVGSFFLQFLIDEILQYSLVKTLHVMTIGMVTLTVFRFLLFNFRGQLILFLMQKLDILIIFNYFIRLLEMPMKLFHRFKTGELIARYGDTYHVREVLANTTLAIMVDLIMAFSSGIILYLQSPQLFGITIVIVICFAVVGSIFFRIQKVVNKETMESNAQMNAIMVESINGIQTLKALNAEEEIGQIAEARFIRNVKSNMKSGSLLNTQNSLTFFIYTIGTILIVWAGSVNILAGKMTIGQLITFNALLAFFLDPLRNLVDAMPTIQSSIVAAERILQVYDHEVEKSPTNNTKMTPDKFNGKIQFEDVYFSYLSGDEPVLKNINMKIQPGDRIALVGESGSGKTTLVKLIMQFYHVTNGSITIDGMNIKDINLYNLRERISYVSQDTFLFSGTIKHNLTLGRPECSMDDIIEAAKIANIDEFINKFPLRYDTLLTENGSNLSGGQRQRLAITRALIKKPDILILDEATSNLDSITEKAIENTINECTGDITTIIIAHRLSTIKKCNKIYVLDNGEIIENGTHQELMKRKKRYYLLWKEQMPDVEVNG